MKNLSYVTILYFVLGLVALYFLLQIAPAFAAFGETFLYLATAIAIFGLFDKYCLPNIDIIDELKKGNNAVGLGLIAMAIAFVAIAVLVG